MAASVEPLIILTLTVPVTPAPTPPTPALIRKDFKSRVEEASTIKPLRVSPSFVRLICEFIFTVSLSIKSSLIVVLSILVSVVKLSLPLAVTLVLSSLSPPTVALVMPAIWLTATDTPAPAPMPATEALPA